MPALVLAFALLLLAPAAAGAVELGASFGGATLTQAGHASGLSADLRLGGTSRAGEVDVTSEIGATFAAMGDARAYGAIGGWRLRFGKLVRLGALFHLGVGYYQGEGLAGFTDLLWQVGGLVDILPAPGFVLGLHLEYTGFFSGAREVVQQCSPGDPRCAGATGPSPNWLNYGVHASVRL